MVSFCSSTYIKLSSLFPYYKYVIIIVQTDIHESPSEDLVPNTIQLPISPVDKPSIDAVNMLSAVSLTLGVDSDGRDDAISEILKLIEPNEAQLNYRASCFEFVSRVVYRLFRSKIFDVGLHALKYFLSTDHVRFSILIGPENSAYLNDWHIRLNAKLNILAVPLNPHYKSVVTEYVDPIVDEECFFHDSQFVVNHEVCDVVLESEGYPDLAVVNFVLDKENSIEVCVNQADELRFLAFLEEVTHLVGKNNLFSRSLLLVRTWWQNSLGLDKQADLLDAHIICVLLCCIFNQHHQKLFRPLQVLDIFLVVFSQLDWRNCVVTINGIISLNDTANDATGDKLALESILKLPTESDLLSLEVVRRYATYSPLLGGASPDSSNHDNSDPKSHFQRLDMNVMHPFTHVNMFASTSRTTSSTTSPRGSVFIRHLKEGADKLNLALVDKTGGLVRDFFSAVADAYRSTGRPDEFHGPLMVHKCRKCTSFPLSFLL